MDGREKNEVSPHKTKAVLPTRRNKLRQEIRITLEEEEIRHKSSVKYLGVHFDKNFTFGTHIRETVKKATLVGNTLTKLLHRLRWPTESKRRLLDAVAISILFYAAPVCRDGLKYACYVKTATSLNRRMAIFVCCEYKTPPSMALEILPRLPSIELMSKYRAKTIGTAKA